MADNTLVEMASSCEKPLEEKIYEHGEYRTGTKEQLQNLGIGVGIAFPSEPNAKPRQITVRDARGWKTQIKQNKEYSAGYARWTGRYETYTEVPDDVRKRRKAEAEAAEKRKEIEARINGMLLTEADFRASIIRHSKTCTNWFEMMLSGEESFSHAGFFFDYETMERLKNHLNAIRYLSEHGRITFRASVRQRAIADKYRESGLGVPLGFQEIKKSQLRLVRN